MENIQAFPSQELNQSIGTEPINKGMTLRDYFAGQALAGYMASSTDKFHNKVPSYVAPIVYEIAKHMLKERIKYCDDKTVNPEIKELQHFKDSSVGLWCTDKPEAIPEDKKHLFFQLK